MAPGYRRAGQNHLVGRWLVDGMNVLGVRPDGWWRDRQAAVAALVAKLGRWADSEAGEVVAVFDGAPPPGVTPGRHGGAVVDFTGPGTTADDEITRRVATDPDPSSLTVVTSDTGLAARVRAHGVAVVGAAGFRRRLD